MKRGTTALDTAHDGFVKDPDVKSLQVHVTTYNGVVELSGFVDKPEQISRAAEVAKGVEGVKSVKNDLTLRPGK